MNSLESAIDVIVKNITDKKTNSTQVQSIITNKLISLSTKNKKVLINFTYGGYSIPKDFEEYIFKTSGEKIQPHYMEYPPCLNNNRELAASYVEPYGKHVFPSVENDVHRLTLTFILMSKLNYSNDDDKIKQDLLESYLKSPEETLKQKHELKIVEIPEFVDYYIGEYDGKESIHIGIDLNQNLNINDE